MVERTSSAGGPGRFAAPSTSRADELLAAQYVVLDILSAATDPKAGLRRALEAIARRFSWDFGSYWELTEGHLHCLVTWHPEELSATRFADETALTVFEVGSNLPGRVVGADAPTWVESLVDDPAFVRRESAREAGLLAGFAFPVRWDGRVGGAMEFFSASARKVEADLLEAMDGFGAQLGQFIARKRREQEVRESEALKAAVLESALDCVITMDAGGKVIDWNRAAEKTFGYPRERAIGSDMAELIIPPALRGRHRQALASYLNGGEPKILDRRLEISALHSGGREFPIELTVTRLATDDPPLFAGFVRDLSEREAAQRGRDRALELEREARVRSQQLLAEALAAEKRQRGKLSETLHDNVLQELGTARLLASICRSGDHPDRLEQLEKHVGRAVEQLRATVSELHPSMLEQEGFEAALRAVARAAEQRSGLQCTVKVGEHTVGYHDELLLSIARELIANSAKHSRAEHVVVDLEREGAEVVLTVADDGGGFSEEAARAAVRAGHIGLSSIRGRVASLEGSFAIASGPDGRGTFARAKLPVASAANGHSRG